MKGLASALHVLEAGGVLIFPTETSYAIGCDATNKKAVAKVFALKGRAAGKGTPLIVSSLAMAKRYGVFSKTALALAKKHWPGPLTIVVPHLPFTSPGDVKLGDTVRLARQGGTVALRVSSHPVALALARRLGRPLVATSANRSGHPPAFRVKDLGAWKGVFVLDAGSLPKRKPSTLVRVIGDNVEVLRKGPILHVTR